MPKPSLDELFKSSLGNTSQAPQEGQSKPSLDQIFSRSLSDTGSEVRPLKITVQDKKVMAETEKAKKSTLNELLNLSKMVVKDLSNPNNIVSGTGGITAQMTLSNFIQDKAQDALVEKLNINSLSNKPFNVAQKVGSVLPGSLPFMNTKTGEQSNIPVGESIQNISPRSLATAAAGEVVNPINYLTGLTGFAKPSPKGIAKMGTKAASLDLKAQQLATEVLKPDQNMLAKSINRGYVLPAVEEAANNIKSVRNNKELFESLNQTTKVATEQRNKLLSEFNRPVDKAKIIEAMDAAIQAERKMQIKTPAARRRLKQMDDAFYSELEFLESNPELDILTAQSRKEALQDYTNKLLDKSKRGEVILPRESAEMVAFDSVRRAYKDAVIRSLPPNQAAAVSRLNKQLEGLIDAKEFAASQAAFEASKTTASPVSKAVGGIGLSPQLAVGKGVARSILDKIEFPRTTGKIQSLRQEANMLRNLVKTAEKMKSKRGFSISPQGFRAVPSSYEEERRKIKS